jgi:hypothetical protein
VPSAGATYPAAPPKPAPLSYQAKEVLLDGRPTMVGFNPQTNTYEFNGQDVSSRVRPIPPQGPQPSYQWAVPPGATKPVLMTPQEIRTSGATSTGAAGETGGVKLTADQQKELTNLVTSEEQVTDALRLGAETKWAGVGRAEGSIVGRFLGSGGEKGETLRNKVGEIRGAVALLRGGQSFTDTEKAMLDAYTPELTDPDWRIQTKLTNLQQMMKRKRENMLRVAHGEYTPREPTAPPPPPPKTNPFRK